MSKTIFSYDIDFARRRIINELERIEDESKRLNVIELVCGKKPKLKKGEKKPRWYGYDVDPKNKRFPSLPMLLAFAKALKKPVEYFIYEENIFEELVKEEFLNLPYIEQFTNGENNLVYRGNKHMCAFRYDSLVKIANRPLETVIYVVDSDTMENTLNKGDEVLIDTSITRIKDGAIYAFNSNDLKYIRIRRFYCGIKELKLIADNKSKYEPWIARPEEINIIGQVIASKHFL